MHPWTLAVLLGCAIALTLALVAALLALRRTLARAASVLAIVEDELRPLIGQAHALTGDLRGLTKEAQSELARLGEVTEQVQATAQGVARMVGALANLTRAGQLVGTIAAVRRGVDVFVQRLKRDQ